MSGMANPLGAFGERYTSGALQRQGFRILARNFTVRGGEIDIIACSAQYIIFVEVKTRMQGSMAAPAESVTRTKQRRMVRAALLYLQAHPSGLQPRFDAACIEAERKAPDGTLQVVRFDYFENAFFPEEGAF